MRKKSNINNQVVISPSSSFFPIYSLRGGKNTATFYTSQISANFAWDKKLCTNNDYSQRDYGGHLLIYMNNQNSNDKLLIQTSNPIFNRKKILKNLSWQSKHLNKLGFSVFNASKDNTIVTKNISLFIKKNLSKYLNNDFSLGIDMLTPKIAKELKIFPFYHDVYKLSNKVNFISLLRQNNILCPPTCVDMSSKALEKFYLQFPADHYFLKPNFGFGSQGIIRCSKDEVTSYIKDKSISFHLQVECKHDRSYCVIFWISDEGPTLLQVSRQRMKKGRYYVGNIVDSNYSVSIVKKSNEVAKLLFQTGVRGHIGIDLLDDNGKYYFLETNLRINGNSALLIVRNVLGRKNKIKQISSNFTLKQNSNLIENLEIDDLLYSEIKNSGAILLKVGRNQGDRIAVAFINDLDGNIERRFVKRLN